MAKVKYVFKLKDSSNKEGTESTIKELKYLKASTSDSDYVNAVEERLMTMLNKLNKEDFSSYGSSDLSNITYYVGEIAENLYWIKTDFKKYNSLKLSAEYTKLEEKLKNQAKSKSVKDSKDSKFKDDWWKGISLVFRVNTESLRVAYEKGLIKLGDGRSKFDTFLNSRSLKFDIYNSKNLNWERSFVYLIKGQSEIHFNLYDDDFTYKDFGGEEDFRNAKLTKEMKEFLNEGLMDLKDAGIKVNQSKVEIGGSEKFGTHWRTAKDYKDSKPTDKFKWNKGNKNAEVILYGADRKLVDEFLDNLYPEDINGSLVKIEIYPGDEKFILRCRATITDFWHYNDEDRESRKEFKKYGEFGNPKNWVTNEFGVTKDFDMSEEIVIKDSFKGIKDSKELGQGFLVSGHKDWKDTLSIYLQWEGIIGYDSDIIDFLEEEDFDGLEEYLTEEGIIGYDYYLKEIYDDNEAYLLGADKDDYIKICEYQGVTPVLTINDCSKNMNDSRLDELETYRGETIYNIKGHPHTLEIKVCDPENKEINPEFNSLEGAKEFIDIWKDEGINEALKHWDDLEIELTKSIRKYEKEISLLENKYWIYYTPELGYLRGRADERISLPGMKDSLDGDIDKFRFWNAPDEDNLYQFDTFKELINFIDFLLDEGDPKDYPFDNKD